MTKEIIEKLQSLTLLYAEDEEGIRKNIADSLGYYVKEVLEASTVKKLMNFMYKKDLIL